jgi:hypothetical protein
MLLDGGEKRVHVEVEDGRHETGLRQFQAEIKAAGAARIGAISGVAMPRPRKPGKVAALLFGNYTDWQRISA